MSISTYQPYYIPLLFFKQIAPESKMVIVPAKFASKPTNNAYMFGIKLDYWAAEKKEAKKHARTHQAEKMQSEHSLFYMKTIFVFSIAIIIIIVIIVVG